jgi:heparan-alpha-glucosaminide N-acetyltransferase
VFGLYNVPSMSTAVESTGAPPRIPRITSIDALRGLVMFTMIFVNDIAGVSPKIVPAWMRHFKGRSGMTFVDLVFPAFLFIVGLSIPFALGGRLRAGETWWKTILHVVGRTLSLLFIGILMVNDESPGPDMSGLSPTLWAVLMFLSAMLAFCSLSPPLVQGREWKWVTWAVRGLGLCGMVALAFMFRGDQGKRIITLSPLAIHTEWYGILGLIGWAYLVGSVVYLTFRANAVALLGCVVLLLGLYPADRAGLFDGVWLGRYLGIGEMLGAHPSITVAGLLLASILVPIEKPSRARTVRFTLLFVLGFAAAALLLSGLYGINKNQATPSWCLWACAITAALWLILHGLCDGATAPRLAKVLAVAGQNVLLAYLISEMLPSLLDLLHLGNAYDALAGGSLFTAIARSAGCAIVILCVTAGLNRAGFRLKL